MRVSELALSPASTPMRAVCRRRPAPSAPRLKIVFAHPAQPLPVDDDPCMTKRRSHATVSIALELVADRRHARDDLAIVGIDARLVAKVDRGRPITSQPLATDTSSGTSAVPPNRLFGRGALPPSLGAAGGFASAPIAEGTLRPSCAQLHTRAPPVDRSVLGCLRLRRGEVDRVRAPGFLPRQLVPR